MIIILFRIVLLSDSNNSEKTNEAETSFGGPPATSAAASTPGNLKKLFPGKSWSERLLKLKKKNKVESEPPKNANDFFSLGNPDGSDATSADPTSTNSFQATIDNILETEC